MTVRALCAIPLAVACVYAIGPAAAAAADVFPQRPVRIVLPYPPGGSSDPMARILAAGLRDMWPQPIVIDNRAGAGGTIANELVAKSSADGHTLLLGTLGTVAIAPFLYAGQANATRDLAAVCLIASGYYVLAVPQSTPASTLREFIALAQARPGQLSYGSGGTGSPPHLAMELLKQTAQIDLVHVPYKGTGPVLTDLIGGQIAAAFGSAVSVLPHAKAGKLKVLAATSARRSALLPDIPTIAESGYPGFEVDAWYGIFVQAATPRAILAQLSKDINQVITRQDTRDRYAAMGLEASATTQAEFAARVARDSEKWRAVVKKVAIRVD
jgi:tripartite-type tricarboxylate transporter receptor subunit TctC